MKTSKHYVILMLPVIVLTLFSLTSCGSSKSAASGPETTDMEMAKAEVAAIDAAGYIGETTTFSQDKATGTLTLQKDDNTVRKAVGTIKSVTSEHSDTYYFNASGQLISSKHIEVRRNCENGNMVCMDETVAYFHNGVNAGVMSRSVSAPPSQERKLVQLISTEDYQPVENHNRTYTSEYSAYESLKMKAGIGSHSKTSGETELTDADVMLVWADGQELRSNPGPNAEVISKMTEGDMLFLTGDRSEAAFLEVIRGRRFTEPYVKVNTQRATTGWIHAGALKVPEHYVVVANYASLRKEPTLRSEVIQELKQGDKVMFYGNKAGNPVELTVGGKTKTDNYYRVRTEKGKIGWLHGATIEAGRM